MPQYNNEEVSQKSNVFDESFELKRRKEFSNREVGITHPDNKGFIRIADSGEIEIFAAPGIGLILNPNTRSVSIIADSIKFFCRDDDGLRWNGKSFNPASDVYNEPALLKTNDFSNNPAYYKSNHFLNNLEQFTQTQEQSAITIMGEYGLGLSLKNDSLNTSDSNGLTLEQKNLINAYAKTHSDSEVVSLVDLMLNGYSFEQALDKIENNDLNNPDSLNNFPWIKNDLDK